MARGTLGMLDAIVTFQDGADLEPTHRQPLDFWRLEHAQATQEHTEQPRTQLGSVFFVDANIVLYFKTAKFVRNIDIINNLTN